MSKLLLLNHFSLNVETTMISSSTYTSYTTTTISTTSTIVQRGVCWNTSINPTIANSKTIDSDETFISELSGLTSGTTYYVRGYAIKSNGYVGYSDNVTFFTECTNYNSNTKQVYNTSSIVMTKPTDTNEGDFMIMQIAQLAYAGDSNPTGDTGWSFLTGYTGYPTAGSHHSLYYKLATASEGTGYTFLIPSNAEVQGGITTFKNVTSIDVLGSPGLPFKTGGYLSATTITTLYDNDLLVMYGIVDYSGEACEINNSWKIGTQTATEIYEFHGGAGQPGADNPGAIGCAFLIQPTKGSTGIGTNSYTGNGNYANGILVSLKRN